MPDTALVIIARSPELGKVKSRLAVAIGESNALVVYKQLLQVVVAVQETWTGPVLLATTGNDNAWANTGLVHLPRRPQANGCLGDRIADALRWGLSSAGQAIAIGTDCPGLRRMYLDQLASLLSHAPVVFGPAVDGGYWGIGVRDPRVIPFITSSTLPWSTPMILAESLKCLTYAGYAHAIGHMLSDCDNSEDLALACKAGFLYFPTRAEHCS